jgi:hypothetical protein
MSSHHRGNGSGHAAVDEDDVRRQGDRSRVLRMHVSDMTPTNLFNE